MVHYTRPAGLRRARQALIPIALGLWLITGCSGGPGASPAGPPPANLGGQRDGQGCLSSAGFRWCARENSCQRPWELSAQKGFAVDRFDAYCSANSNR